jgi:FixJ family two-component response regulator
MLMHTPGAVPGETDVTREGVVVVIDDDATVRAALKELLESVGLNVKLYPSGSAFLKDGISDATSCLVLDVRLPAISGLKVQEELARAGLQVPLIFITEHGSIAIAVQAMKAGAVDFLTKPVNEQDLLDAIFAALTRDRMRRAQEEALSALRERSRSLSARECEVLYRVAAGRLNKQIADELGVSEIMVKVHRSHGMRKMNAKSVAELVRMSDLLRSEFLTKAAQGNAPRVVTSGGRPVKPIS